MPALDGVPLITPLPDTDKPVGRLPDARLAVMLALPNEPADDWL